MVECVLALCLNIFIRSFSSFLDKKTLKLKNGPLVRFYELFFFFFFGFYISFINKFFLFFKMKLDLDNKQMTDFIGMQIVVKNYIKFSKRRNFFAFFNTVTS